MKHTIIAIALLAAVGSASAVEDLVARSADGTITATVHASGIQSFINKNGDVQVFAYVSRLENNSILRYRVSVSGCNKQAGTFAIVDEKIGESEQMIWLLTGERVMDDIARKACLIASQTVKAHRVKNSGYSM